MRAENSLKCDNVSNMSGVAVNSLDEGDVVTLQSQHWRDMALVVAFGPILVSHLTFE